MRYRNMLIALAMGVGLLDISAWGQIPTVAERIRDSGRNPQLCTWKAEDIRPSWPPPKRETNQPPLAACFRHDFNLSAKPRQAAITLLPRPTRNWWLKVNGQVVAAPLQGELVSNAPVTRSFDIARFLCVGHNVITVKMDDGESRGILLAEGIVFGEDGSTVRLLTDKTWKGGWSLPEGWDKPETDPAKLPPVGSLYGFTAYKWGVEGEMNPPYYGPIQVMPVGMSQPLFDEEKVAELKVTVVNGAKLKLETGNLSSDKKENSSNPSSVSNFQHPISNFNLSYEIFDENSRKVMGTNVVALTPEGKLDLTGTLKYGPLPQGVYRFRFVLTSGTNEVDRRDYEVVSVGVIKQRLVEGTSYEDGLDLKQVWSVDCTQAPNPGEFAARYAYAKSEKDRDVVTIVTNGPAGTYRTLAVNYDSRYFAYRFKVKRLFVPHLAVVEWPDDAPRNFQVHVMEGTTMVPPGYGHVGGGWARGEAAVRHVDRYPFSNRMQKLHILYWPNEEDGAVHIFNLGGASAPAAAARITVYEIANDLPALRIADAGDRLIGCQTEEGPGIIARTYYAGPLGQFFALYPFAIEVPEFYRSWYTTTQNLIKRMRFSGQNLCLMGHLMYYRVLYPSERAEIAATIKRDSGGIMLRMFERNGMSMISGMEYAFTKDLIDASPATPEQVRAGAPTLFCVGKDGNFGGAHGMKWGVNYFHPQVQESVLALVGELADLYKEYPAWKGVGFLLSRAFGPMAQANTNNKDDPLNWGYEDYTFDLFQNDTGISIPVSPPFDSAQGRKDPDRFQKRYDRLMANPAERDKWINWRCAQYTQLYRKMRDRLVNARPDLKLYLIDVEPLARYMSKTSAQDLIGHLDDPAALKHILKMYGFDAETLKKENGIVLACYYLSPGTHQAEGVSSRIYEDIALNQGMHDLFANDGKGGAFIWAGFEEHRLTGIGGIKAGAVFAPGQWVFQWSVGSLAYAWPKGAYINGAFVNALVRSDPTWIPHTAVDYNDPVSRLHEMGLFARAYRSLPNGKYERLTGNGLDRNIWVKSIRIKDAEYAYAANTDWWEKDVTLTFAPGVKVHDLIKDLPEALQNGKWSFHLGPYEVQTFRVDKDQKSDGEDRASSVVGAAMTLLSPAAEAAVRDALQRGEQVVARARAREAELREMPGWAKVANLEDMIKKIKALMAAGDMSQAYEVANSGEFELAQTQVVNEALDAIPFLVLGPLGNPKDTEGAGKDMGNCAVVPEFRGMETAFIGESSQVDLNVLVPGFKPDRSKTYRVYPGKDAKWQTATKTSCLSFCPQACSAHPLWMTAYAYTEMYSPEERDVVLWLGSDHALWVWLNDALVFKHGGHGTVDGGQRPSVPDQNRCGLKLQKGWNRLLMKAVQRGDTRIFFRITDFNAKPLNDLRFRMPPAAP